MQNSTRVLSYLCDGPEQILVHEASRRVIGIADDYHPRSPAHEFFELLEVWEPPVLWLHP